MAPRNMVNVSLNYEVSNSMYGCVSSGGNDYQNPASIKLYQIHHFPS